MQACRHTYWNTNKQAAKPFDEHLSESLGVLLRQSVEEVSAKEIKPYTAVQGKLAVCELHAAFA